MNGWLITNAFLHSNKFSEISLWLMEAAKKHGIDLIHKTNDEVLITLDEEFENTKKLHDKNKPDFVLFWDKDVRLAHYLELQGYNVFNNSKAISLCDDKSLTHMTLQSEGISMPRTIIAPMTFANIGFTNLEFLDSVEHTLGYPLIVKECFGSFGMQVYLVNNKEELRSRVEEIGIKPMLFQEFIKHSSGKDIRLQVVGNQVVATMYRYSENGDFRANITSGGKMKPYEPTKEQTELAISCCKIMGLDFAGVDILFGENDKPIVCEVNSNAHFKNIYDCTEVNVADHIMEYIIKKICIG